jgi:hypothetical protein
MHHSLRNLLLATLLAVLGAVSPALAGTVDVNTTSRLVNTSRLAVLFDHDDPDVLLQVFFKDLSPTLVVTAYNVGLPEFWGQTFRNTASMGFTVPYALLTSNWQVTRQSATFAEITTSSQTSGQPAVETRYRFFADQPYFTVERTVLFSTHADTAAYQPYVVRMAQLYPYHAARWRDTTGTVIQRGFCATTCLESNWNGRWTEMMQSEGTRNLAITSIYSSSLPARTRLVRGQSTQTQTDWVAPIIPAGSHTTDETFSEMIAFSTHPESYATNDSLWTVYNSGSYLTGVPAGRAAGSLHLSLSPNPANGPARIEWTDAVAGAHALEVLDVSGRRVASLQAGWMAAGSHAVTWDGRDAAGHPTRPGLYFVRLSSAGGSVVSRLVRAR